MMGATANELWQLGVIEMKFTSKGETVTFNYQNYTRLKEVMHTLTSEQIDFLITLGAPIERLAP
jgi:hypothetical protein